MKHQNEYQKWRQKQINDFIILLLFVAFVASLLAITIIYTNYTHTDDTDATHNSYANDSPIPANVANAVSGVAIDWSDVDVLTAPYAPCPAGIAAEEIEQTTEATTEQEREIKPQYEYNLSDYEKNLLCFMAEGEGGYSIESRMACMSVAINRAYHSDRFKQDNIHDVLFAPKQFQTMHKYPNPITNY